MDVFTKILDDFRDVNNIPAAYPHTLEVFLGEKRTLEVDIMVIENRLGFGSLNFEIEDIRENQNNISLVDFSKEEYEEIQDQIEYELNK